MKKTASVILFLLVMAAVVRAQSSAYKMAGPYGIVARDGQYRNTKAGSERDMKAALDFAEAGKADEALAIINAYAGTLQRLDGHDAPLCLIQGYDLVRAMTRLSAHKTTAWDEMLRRAFLPAICRFDADSPYANGNWGAIVNRMRMAMAIEMGDSVLYRESVDYFLHANDNGSLPRYISETGQCQERVAIKDTCNWVWKPWRRPARWPIRSASRPCFAKSSARWPGPTSGGRWTTGC